jgi:hypothetical protein
MTKTTQTLPAETGGTDITRFNALRHGVLSRYTVLPWENADEYRAVVEGLVAEHGPHGPTEEHLVEEIAGILWRKRRLRLAEAAAHRRGLDGTLASYRETVKVALVHLDTAGQSERVLDAIRATAADTEGDIADMTADEVMTRRALDLLGSKRNDAYEAALAARLPTSNKRKSHAGFPQRGQSSESTSPRGVDYKRTRLGQLLHILSQ